MQTTMKHQAVTVGRPLNPPLSIKMPATIFNPEVDSNIPKLAKSSTTSSFESSSPVTPDVPGPPVNFSEVCPGVYRCGFPKSNNFDFLRGLGLKTVLTLVSDAYPTETQEFMLSNGIIHVQIPIPPNKDTFDSIPLSSMERALNVISDERNHPILVHCNKGKHRTGCVVACYRKISDWTMGSILQEYRHFAGHKARKLDEKYIELFDENAMRMAIEESSPATFGNRRSLLTPESSPIE